MLKRGLNGKTLGALCMLVMSALLALLAAVRSDAWTVNPSEYRYDMSLFFSVPEDFEDLNAYEIGAFINDECRGVAERMDIPGSEESCLYMRIRSNTSSGEKVVFKMRVRGSTTATGVELKGANDFTFQADQLVGTPKEPYQLVPYFTVNITAGSNGTVSGNYTKPSGEGGTFANGTYPYGTTINLTAKATSNSMLPVQYTFINWSDGNGQDERTIIVNNDINITANFNTASVKSTNAVLKFVIDQSGVPKFEEERTFYNSQIIVFPEAPVVAGYTFDKWSSPSTNISNGAKVTTTNKGNYKITGTYTINSYTVTFVVGDDFKETHTLEFGQPITEPTAPSKEGYTFDGWQNVPETMPAYDITVEGSYTINKYTATFVIDGEEVSRQTLDYGAAIIAPGAPVKEGFIFAGWQDLPKTMPAEDITITGKYNRNSYTVTFVVGDDFRETRTFEYGANITAPTAPVREGYIFSRWENLPATMPAHNVVVNGIYIEEGANIRHLEFVIEGEVVESMDLEIGEPIKAPEVASREGYSFEWENVPATMPDHDLIITGTYTVLSFTLTFKIDDEEVKKETLEYGAAIKAPEVSEKVGYTFSGWQNVPATMPAHDLEITGSYNINTYEAVFKIDGVVFQTLEIEYNAPVTAPDIVTKEGYTFSGWDELPATMPAHDIEVNGTYTANLYTATFKIGNNIISEEKVAFGTTITVPDAPAKEGYTFAGWGEVPATMPARDLVFEGSYTVNTYTATFKIGEDVISEEQVEYGAAITVPDAPEKEGYTFAGWGEVPATMPAGDIVIEGSYTVNSYTVTFKIGADIISEEKVEYGAAITVPDAPAKEGYTFAGWGEVPATMPAGDLVIEGSYTVNSYTVTFKIGEDVISEEQVEYGAAITVPDAPEKEGYTFSGWGEVPKTMPARDLVIEGSYTVNNYTATFKIGEDVVATLTLAYGAVIEAPEAPEKEGYTFDGWKEFPKTMPAEDIVIEGSYSVNTYTAIFKIGEMTIAELKVAYGAAIEVPTAPEKTGYTFDGWKEVPATMPAEDIVIEGSYSLNIYKAVFKIDGATIATLDVPYGAAIETPAVADKEGYTFGGWDNLPETMPANDIEVTGSYTVNIYKAVFVIDGATIATLEVAYGAAVEAPEAPEKEGYTFDGWKDVPVTMPARDIEIEGSYTRVSTAYTVTFVIDGKTVHTATVEAGDTITLPEAPEKEGHTFAGWQGVPEVMPSENITVTGSYTVNSYTATFIIDGVIVETLSIEYGAAVNAPAAPGKEDHTFAGWQDLPATMPAHDIAVTGTYTYSPDIFKAVFMIDGETIATLEVSCGSPIKAPEAPAKVGHTFAGWRDIPSEMPHHDVVIEGSYTVNSYNAVFVIDGETIETLSVEYGAVINAPIAPAKEDHIFDGWKDVPETMPAHDIEVTGSYTYSPDIFNVVFMADNEVIASYQLECGTPITAPRAPVKKGYTFSGWQDVPEVVPHHDVTITGTFIPNVYSVIFVVDGEVIETAEVECGAVITAPEMPEKEYHTFSGWLNLPEVMPAKSIEVVGNYHADVFHAVFVIDGSVFERQSVEYGAVITAPVAPEREDYTFSGWQNLPETMPGRDIEVTGSYTYSPDLYKAVFLIDGEIFATLELEPGQAITAPSVAEREGHTFSGWQDVPAEMPNHDVTVSGSYTVNSYNAVFVIDGEIIATLSVEYGAAINVPAAPDREDYTFDGWKDVPATMPARDIAVSGSYTYSPDIFNAVFMIDGETYATVAVEAGEPVELPAEPFREGYTFSDWQDVPDVMPNHDIVVSGSFTVNSYQAIFVIDNEILESLTVEYGAPVNAPAAPEKENQTFTGWLDLPATMPAHDIAVTGTYAYSAGVFNAVFMIDGQTVATVQAEAGKAIALPEAPAREGHTFAGWQDVPSVMPHHDVTVSGSYAVNSYDILFVVNGEVIKTVSVEYGATVEAPEMPEKEGYSFSGWLNLPATMPAKSMEVVGNYHAGIYHAVFVIDGRVFETHSVEYGSVITVPAAPEREDYTFSGWQNLPETMPARDIEVTGSYTYSPDSFKAVFMIDGEVLETRTFRPGAAVTVPEAAEREGHTFSGWQDVPETMPHHDVTVSGSYTVNSYQVIFIIEGEMTATLNVEYGSVINAPAAPEREDYRFDGWKDLPETMPAHDVVVTGSYTYSPDIFNAVFMIGEETYATIAVEAGEPVVLPAEPFREGHTFSGWQEIPSVMPNHDIVISGSYTANSYQAIFMIDGEVLESLMVEYGTVINAPAAPEKEGLTFTGWLDLPATMPAHDIVLTGSYVDSDGKYLAV
ncbi:MAG: InlB B-repeat-containing protein, partial [Bacteroides sp.]|nr:InlB B-repeat-containing protein [Bacteroides sp.]